MKNILLIEDNRDLRENTKEILELANYQVAAVSNGKEGIEEALRTPPDLILCDILMPELDGYGVLHSLQKNDSIRNIPFIFLTAKTEPMDFRKGMELGADDYIAKPFGITDLLTAVESRLKKMERLREEITHSVQQSSAESALGSTDPDLLLTENRDTNFYKKKQVIYTEGNRPTKVFYVVKGKVKTSKRNDEGKELVLAVYHEDDFFGY
ncbi:MAG: response regulator, partial [Microcystis sp.]